MGRVLELVEEGTRITVGDRTYVIGRRIADITTNSAVYSATLENGGGKLVFKYIRPTVSRELVQGEIQANETLSGAPFMVLGYDFVEINGSVGYFMDYFNGGDLLDFITQTTLSETLVREMAVRVLRAIRYMHGLGWAHRDIKLENIFLSGSGDCPDTFLGDLGMAAEGEVFYSPLGSLPYCAPELLIPVPGVGFRYGAAVDMWAFGVTVFAMLTCQMPFPDPRDCRAEFVSAVANERWSSDAMIDAGCSQDAIDLITGLLKANPDERLTADQALDHPFFSGCGGAGRLKDDLTDLDEAMGAGDEFDF